MKLPAAQRSNYDVLSVIFTMAFADWRAAALTLSSVCRLWRYIALSMPNIWSVPNLDSSKKSYKLQICLERSKPLPFHIYIPSFTSGEQLQVLSSATDRIVCMTIWDCGHFLHNQFPVLERLDLEVDIEEDTDSLHCLSNASQFPQLQELYLFKLSTAGIVVNPPQKTAFALVGLKKLEVLYWSSSYWFWMVQSVSSTLVSLILHTSYHALYLSDRFSFPRLRHLQIITRKNTLPLVLDLDAPSLESVDEGFRPDRANATSIRLRHPKSVKQLRSGCFPLDLTSYPALRKLWISNNSSSTRTMVRALTNAQIASCPELEAILYCDHSRPSKKKSGQHLSSRPAPALSVIVELVRKAGRNIAVGEFHPTELDLPGAMRRPVGIPLTVFFVFLWLTGMLKECLESPCLREWE
jgi:hypothetical protein